MRKNGFEVAKVLFAFCYTDYQSIAAKVNHDLIFIRYLKLKNSGIAQGMHGMVKVKESDPQYQVISVHVVMRPIHLVPTDVDREFFLNQYISLEDFNTFY